MVSIVSENSDDIAISLLTSIVELIPQPPRASRAVVIDQKRDGVHDAEEEIDQTALTMQEIQPFVRDARQQRDQIVLSTQREDDRSHCHPGQPGSDSQRRRTVAPIRAVVGMLGEHEHDCKKPREDR